MASPLWGQERGHSYRNSLGGLCLYIFVSERILRWCGEGLRRRAGCGQRGVGLTD